ncbi:MAG: lipid-binding SYLF domain-containing protein [Acidobacteriota bacterium]|jgi:lipid-binding SYLF domain-containing protein|nr:lipid-binding SYLF domain-containing protein [Acidobacteriota bacterium]
MRKSALFIIFSLIASSALFAASEVNDRVVHAAIVLKEVTQISEKSIPQDLLDKSACVAVIPSLKRGGFIFGGSYGKGVISCRTKNGDGPWSAPTMFSLQGGSFGLQIGVQAVDLVLVIMNLSGIDSLLNSKFTLGGDASVAAGPVGRTAAAQTDAFMSAQILAYSRSRGLFGGLVLKGEAIRPDKDANYVLYGKQIEPRNVLLNQATDVPKDAKIFIDELMRISPKKK